MEHRRVGLVVVGAVDAARADDPHGRLADPLHRPDLHGRGVGPEEDGPGLDAVAQRGLVRVERVLHVARGVVGRDVQRFEVVPVELDLRPARDLVAEPREDAGDLLGRPGDGVAVPARDEPARRERHVDGRALQLRLELRLLEPAAGAVELLLDVRLDAVRDLADARAVLGGELAHAAQHRGELALLAEEADPQLLERLLVGGARDGIPGALRERLELCEQVRQRSPR
jgi:hypothetical protein